MKAPKNIGVSVRDRLIQRAREHRENAQLLMTRYAIERILYRLGVSQHRDRFVLKGAMSFSRRARPPYRATGDLDVLGFGENSPDAISAVFVEILGVWPVGQSDEGRRGQSIAPSLIWEVASPTLVHRLIERRS
jgi:hypothetical protein